MDKRPFCSVHATSGDFSHTELSHFLPFVLMYPACRRLSAGSFNFVRNSCRVMELFLHLMRILNIRRHVWLLRKKRRWHSNYFLPEDLLHLEFRMSARKSWWEFHAGVCVLYFDNAEPWQNFLRPPSESRTSKAFAWAEVLLLSVVTEPQKMRK